MIQGDCLVEMDKLIKKRITVNLIITSPPYNIGNMHSNNVQYGSYNGNDMKENEYRKWQVSFLNKCFDMIII